MANLRYTTCIRTEENFCGIKWQKESFSWGWPFVQKFDSNATMLSATGEKCNIDDYIGIDQGSLEDNNPYALDEDRFCGLNLMNSDQVFCKFSLICFINFKVFLFSSTIQTISAKG